MKFITSLAIAILVPVLGYANDITVNTFNQSQKGDGKCSLGEAVAAANNDGPSDACPAGNGADVIVLPTGTYELTVAEDASAGVPQVVSVLVIRSDGQGPVVIRRNSINNFRMFNVSGAGDLTLEGITVENGSSPAAGGGFYVNPLGKLTLKDCVLDSNKASTNGGGIFNDGGIVTLNNTIVRKSSAGTGGGAYVTNGGSLSITSSEFSLNQATVTTGGGINIFDAAKMTSLTVEKSRFRDNSSAQEGGAISASNKADVNIQKSAFLSNSASKGGAFAVLFGANLISFSSTFSSNQASGEGGGGFVFNATTAFLNSTITLNSAATGGGLYRQGPDSLSIQNTILSGNSAAFGTDCSGTIDSAGNNIVGDIGNCTFNSLASDQIADPKLSPLVDDKATEALYHPLLSGSPAIDKIAPIVCIGVLGEDQLGHSRVFDCDIGAIEAACGDSITHSELGEACDDGNTSNVDTCLSTCKPASCGDGFVQAGVEGCDDGNLVDGDGCSAACAIEVPAPQQQPNPQPQPQPDPAPQPGDNPNPAPGDLPSDPSSPEPGPSTPAGGGCSLVRS